jgi:hypothetical protein
MKLTHLGLIQHFDVILDFWQSVSWFCILFLIDKKYKLKIYSRYKMILPFLHLHHV